MFAQKGISGARLASRVALLVISVIIIAYGSANALSPTQAEEIMGSNFLGPEEGGRLFGFSLSAQELATFSEVPFSEATLNECRNSHFLVAVPSISISQIRQSVSSDLFFLDRDEQSYTDRVIFQQRGVGGWQLVQKTPVENSPQKSWRGQLALLDTNSEVPVSRVMAYAIIGYYLKNHEKLFPNIAVRCGDPMVTVGSFGSFGLFVKDDFSCLDRAAYVGLASCRKPDKTF